MNAYGALEGKRLHAVHNAGYKNEHNALPIL